jgi:hypothetical protein
MAFLKRGPAAAVTTASTTVIGTIDLGAPFGIVRGFQARNWASSAKAAAGTDALEKVKLTDANGVVIFLDAADRDYKTAAVQLFFDADDTLTGLGITSTDATGAARAAGEGAVQAVVQSPITVEIQDAGTATDYFELFLYVEV